MSHCWLRTQTHTCTRLITYYFTRTHAMPGTFLHTVHTPMSQMLHLESPPVTPLKWVWKWISLPCMELLKTSSQSMVAWTPRCVGFLYVPPDCIHNEKLLDALDRFFSETDSETDTFILGAYWAYSEATPAGVCWNQPVTTCKKKFCASLPAVFNDVKLVV